MEGRRIPLRILLATAAALAVWVIWHPPVLQHPDSDLYEHLSVARHLLAGDGFVNDIAYPLSYAFPFATEVPQPLIHRPPGYPLWMTLAVLAGRGDAAASVTAAGWLTIAVLGAIVVMGLLEFRRRNQLGAATLWLPLLIASPLVDMTVRWAQVEVLTALVLLAIWRRGHGGIPGRGRRHGLLTGLLCGLTALLRFELLWLPWLWLVLRARPAPRRWWLASILGCLLTLTPWAVRNTVITGNPVFTLQAYAEHLKETPDHPGMSVYLDLEPESFTETMRRDSGPILRKSLDGVIYQLARADNWIPWPLAIVGVIALALRRSVPGVRSRLRPLVALGLGWAAMVLLYAPLSHDLRYMMVLLPVVLLELASTVHAAGRSLEFASSRPWAPGLMTAVLAVVILLSVPPRMPGWERSRDDAQALWLDAGAALARTQTLPPGPIITDHGAVFWLSGRAGVIRPATEEVSDRLRAMVTGLEQAVDVRGAPETE